MCNASVPYGVRSRSLPNSKQRIQKAIPSLLGTAISKDNSPEKEILKTLASKFPSFPSKKSSGLKLTLSTLRPPNFSKSNRAFGPAIVI